MGSPLLDLRQNLAACAVALCAFLPALEANGQAIPAFPGAEGAGAYAKGGRGGDVYHVTNTNSSGPGSFAYGLTTGVPAAGRTIVFDVSGYATISSVLRVTASKITIAGQTAPGDGFGIKGNTFRISGDDIVLRHMRFRAGHTADAVNLDSGSLNSIFDHCDVMFGGDENFSSFDSPPENMTYQWSLNAWGIESHSCGGLWDQNHATGHHSLWAHNHTRNPKARPAVLDWTNNVTFDWDIGFIMGDSETPANWNANVRGNYFVCPPGNLRSRALEKANLDRNGNPNFSIFVQDNLFDKDGDGLLNGQDYGYGIASGSYTQLAGPLANNGVPLTIDPPLTAYKKVVSAAGPLRLEVDPAKPIRDEVTTILVGNLVAQRRHHISGVAQTGASNGGFGTLTSSAAPVDTDRDGMPDFYETALGWNAAAQDHNTALANSGGFITGTTFLPANTVAGYTRLEEYLHYKAIPHGTVAKNIAGSPTSLDVELRKFTSGFSASPTFTIANVLGGAIVQSGPGGSLVTFTPTLNYVGRARFDFTVTDAQGNTWTQTCAIVVTNTGLPRDLIWKGTGSLWDTMATNWLRPSNGATLAFSDGDRVAFDQTGSTQANVTVSGTLAPTTVEVNATSNYAVGGSGTIASTGTLTKRGSGTLTLSHLETYAGGSSLEAGAIHLAEGGGLAGGKLSMLDGTIVSNVHGANNTATLAAPIEVPPGNAATLRTGNRISLNGALTGEGKLTFDVQTTVSRADLKGATAGFAGDIHFISGGGVRLFYVGGSFNGFDNANVDLGGSVSLQPQTNSGGNTLSIGALSGGSAGATLAGGAAGMVTYAIGSKGMDTTFAGSIGTNAALTKTGTGSLTLSGANTHTGATSVNGGALIVDGSLGASAVSIASGAMLAGGGTIGGTVAGSAGSFLSPGTVPFTGATMNVGSGLSLNANTLYFDLSSSPTGANDKIVMNGGTLALAGAPTFQFLLLDGALAAGNYNLITGATSSSVSGTPGALPHNLVSGSRQTFTVKRSAAGSNPSTIWLEVLGDPATLTWTGATSAVWDTSTANNWSGANPNTFTTNDAVVFNDTSAVNTIAIPTAVSPRSIIANNVARAYTIGGTDPAVAAITGSASLAKSGGGALTLTGTNSFTGGTTINAGATITLANDAANAGALGAGRVTLNGGTLTMYSNVSGFNDATFHFIVPAGQTGTFNADARTDILGTLSGGGTFTVRVPWIRTSFDVDWSAFTGTINIITDGNPEPGGGANTTGDFRMDTDYSFAGFPQASVNLGDKVWAYYTGILASGAGTTIEIGELSGTATSMLQGGETGGRNFTYRIGGKTAAANEVTFAGSISEQNTGTISSFVKTGAGTWRLSGNCAWNGGTTIEQGTLKISGSVTSGASTNVAPGATLAFAGGNLTTETVSIAANASVNGNGTITADVTNYGTITCGNGTLVVTGDIVNNGTMRITGGATLTAMGTFINNGVLDLLSSAADLPPGLVNNGVVIDNRDRRILSATKIGSDFTCSVQGYPGHTYQLQRAISPGGTWSNIGPAQAGTGSLLTLTDAGGATGSQKFYRVFVAP